MSEKHLILKSEASDDDFPLQVKTPTRGPLAVDVTRLYRERGLFTYDPGFMSTASCESSITYIDGEEGVLEYRGYPIQQLAEQADYLEVAYLLLYGELPDRRQLDEFNRYHYAPHHAERNPHEFLYGVSP